MGLWLAVRMLLQEDVVGCVQLLVHPAVLQGAVTTAGDVGAHAVWFVEGGNVKNVMMEAA